jgi:hypothetical protein
MRNDSKPEPYYFAFTIVTDPDPAPDLDLSKATDARTATKKSPLNY